MSEPKMNCTSCLGPGRIWDSGNEFAPHPECGRCHGTGIIATRCSCSFPHPPHDFCDGNSDAPMFPNLGVNDASRTESD